MQSVPVINFSQDREALLAEINIACQQWGFFQLVGHPLNQDQLQNTLSVAKAFFSQERIDKLSVERSLEKPWGFYDRELTKNQQDRKEIYDFCPTESAPWPTAPPSFRETMDAYVGCVHEFSLTLLALVCESLGCSPDDFMAHFSSSHSSFCRLNYYPIEIAEDSLSGAPLADLGISHHTDAGALTLLLQDECAGLQVWFEEQWQTVDPIPGALTVNIGDMLQVWSNDVFKAPVHRVLSSVESPRYSIAYFLNPSYEADIFPAAEPPLYRSVNWGEFRGLRSQGDFGDYGEEVQISQYRLS